MSKTKKFHVLIISSLIAAASSMPIAVLSATSDASAKFEQLSDQFMKEMLVLSPTGATQAGYHKHVDPKTGDVTELDELLDDMSPDAMNGQHDFFVAWRKRFRDETPVGSLSPEAAADWHLIDDQIALQLLELDEIQNYRHNPTTVVELIGNAIFSTLSEDYAPAKVRLGHALSRMSQIPRLLEQVKAYLNDADPIFVSTAIEENDGNIDLIENTLAKEIPPGSELRMEYDRSSPAAVHALKDFNRWLKDDLGKRPCHHPWYLGKDLFARKFKLVMEVGVTPEELLKDAEEQMESVRKDMFHLAEKLHKDMFPDHDEHGVLPEAERANLFITEVLNKIADEHPRRDKLQSSIEADLSSIIQFIKDHKVVSLGPRDNLKVVPTPIFERGVLSVAAFHSAPPLNPKSEAEYWVTPIESSVPEKTAESRLREYNNYALKWLTIHEALPGHYVQFEHLNELQPEGRRLLRSLFGNGAYIEGWAEYIAQVMMDSGFLDNDPKFRMVMRKIRLRVLSNAILDIKMQTMGMTDAEAMELMTKRAFQTQAEAAGKLKRAKLTSAQLCTYWVGLSQWFAFRKRYQESQGKDFDMLKFHDRALDEGPLPVPVVEQLLLPADSKVQ
jgi:uncharacterized protein (DUF885 family)